MKAAVLILGILLCSAATAGPPPWMKKANPDTLLSVVGVEGDCDVSEQSLQQVVDGVLIRSRLKTGNYVTGPDPFGLAVKVGCGDGLFLAQVHFVRYMPELGRHLVEVDWFSSYGLGDRDYILRSTKELVENAVTDYLQANFDLTPE